MKDKFGTFRGKCGAGCKCLEFKSSSDGSVRCAECNHAPVKHDSLGILAYCKGCNECDHFESSYGNYEFCEYCECSVQKHSSAPPQSPLSPSSLTPSPAPDKTAEPAHQATTQIDVQHNIAQLHSVQTPDRNTALQQQAQPSMVMNTAPPQTYSQPFQQSSVQNASGYTHQYGTAFTAENSVGMEQMGASPQIQMGQLEQMGHMGQMGQINQVGAMGQMGQIGPMGPMNQFGLVDQMSGTNQMSLHSQINPIKCAIQECQDVPFFDASTGVTQACCSIMHAMEHERRKAMGSNVIKGMTHCLLPSCDRHVWPFMNYCGRTHATAGMAQGLRPPDPNAGARAQKEISEGLCALPGCQKPRYTCPHELTQGDHVVRRIVCGGSGNIVIEHHGVFLGDLNLSGYYIPNAVATVSSSPSENPVLILTLEEFSCGQSLNRVSYPANISRPSQQVVRSCVDYATGHVSLNGGGQVVQGNLSQDFVFLCKFGFQLSYQLSILCLSITNGDLKSLTMSAKNMFLIALTFHKYFLKSGRYKVTLETLMAKLRTYKKALMHGDFQAILNDVIKSDVATRAARAIDRMAN